MPQAQGASAFYFVQITDTHLGLRDHDERLNRAVDLINRLPMPVECVVHTGDISADNLDNPTVLATATSTLSRLRVPWYALPGNHDIRAKNLPKTLAIYTNALGPLCRKVEIRGVEFLLLYTEPLHKGVQVDGYDPMSWLESELKAAGSKPVLVFHHAESEEDFYDNKFHPTWPAESRERWKQILNSADVKAVISGHFHRDELHWLGRVPLYVSAPLAGYYGRQGSFRVYKYEEGRLSYYTVYLEGPK